jgi:DNA-directed RNA polymerase beta subunit
MFSDVSTDLCEKLYEEHGIKDYGCTDLYNGDTGEKLKARIFVAPNFYMRLQKFAVTAKYCVNQGPIDIVTRQAIHSRSRGGGSRLGEMELASIYSSGTPHTLKEKAYNCSDGCVLYFCRNCGQRAEFNKDPNYIMYNCSKCKDKRNIVALDSTWSLNLFIASLNSMGIDLQMNFDDPSIETHHNVKQTTTNGTRNDSNRQF